MRGPQGVWLARHCDLPTDFSSRTSLSLEKPMIRARILHVLACSASLIAADCASGQPRVGEPDLPSLPGSGFPADGAAYCPDLKRLAALAATKDRFAGIAGRPRDGNFVETTLPLAGWRDCALYGPRSYTCDSDKVATAARGRAATPAPRPAKKPRGLTGERLGRKEGEGRK